jgi:predicted enzyme related to lactoylglutathione lyase
MNRRIQVIVIDCSDPARLAAFWSALLDAPADVRDEAWATVSCEPVPLAFQRVPEGKQSPKNRLHLDIEDDDLLGAAIVAQELGAIRQGEIVAGDEGGFLVMTDPEGNEFCFVTP